ncbi:hypothetical protein [Candidatus Hecatella orcuttiae]|uniref:hypothetical protein n=1 Tax=Candidatus Hecatella orcuttiae TaxID=1935119 RepID=UPI002867C3C3|nr:hypothetical protein [Candidatus Hecatella orcuttiae]
MGELKVFLENKKVKWSESDPSSVEEAKKIFQEKLKQGWLAYKRKKHLRKVTTEFDPEADEITLAPPVAGG